MQARTSVRNAVIGMLLLTAAQTGFAQPNASELIQLDLPLVDALQLTPEQDALRQEVTAQRQALAQTRREALAALRERTKNALSAEIPDLRAVAADREETFELLRVERQALVDLRLDFFDSLTAEQQQTIIDALLRRIERAERRAARFN